MSGRGRRLDEIIGMDVINTKAEKIGKIDSIALDELGKVQFIVKLEDGKEHIVTQENVLAIADVMLIKSPTETTPSSMEGKEAAMTKKAVKKAEKIIVCPFCGFINRPGSKYCTNCGKPLT